jgi:hypothetical protein
MTGFPLRSNTHGLSGLLFTTKGTKNTEFFYGTQIYTDLHRLFFHHEGHEDREGFKRYLNSPRTASKDYKVIHIMLYSGYLMLKFISCFLRVSSWPSWWDIFYQRYLSMSSFVGGQPGIWTWHFSLPAWTGLAEMARHARGPDSGISAMITADKFVSLRPRLWRDFRFAPTRMDLWEVIKKALSFSALFIRQL